jgi:hypothetical protein
MIIFNQEKSDGLHDQLLNNSIAYQTDITVKEPTELLKKTVANYLPNHNDQIDLYWLETVLASVGWNANTDIFTKEDTWLARKTPVNKPVNFMHNGQDIIGHMVDSLVVAEDGSIIQDGSYFEEIPDKYDVVTSAVLYRVWDDEEDQERMDNLINEIREGKWSVSMECRFNAFDYGLISPNGEQKVVARDEKTSFLTKFLRFYGGSGEWEGYKIGRVLRNFIFTGKGIVNNPANKRSVILTSDFANASLVTLNEVVDKEVKMPEENKSIEFIEKTLASALQVANERIAAMEKENDEKVKALKEKIATVEAAKEEKDDESYASLEASYAEEKAAWAAEKEDMEKEKMAMSEKVAALETQVAELTAEKVSASRAAQLIKAGVAEDKVEALVATWSEASEAQFDSMVEVWAKVDETEESKASDIDLEKSEAEEKTTLTEPSDNTDSKFKALAERVKSNFKGDE